MIINKYLSSKKTKPQKANSESESRISRRLFLKSISACSVIIASGCQSANKTALRIDYSNKTSIPPLITPSPPAPTIDYGDIPWDWIPPSSVEKGWTAIIVHHSGTERGDAAMFDTQHKSLGWDGVGYDFVIGNGTDSADGQVEVTFRWRQQKVGAHCRAEPDNWANIDGIGICLVGNFNNRQPSSAQMQSLVKLTKFLQKRYGIFKSEIFGHKNTRGAHITDCPGHMFPMASFKAMLNY